MRKISFIPYVCSAGGKIMGSERAALDLKDSSLVSHLRETGLNIDWQVDPAEIYAMPFGEEAHRKLPPLGSPDRKEIVLWHCRALQEQVMKAVNENALPVTLGGDHAMAVGSISAVAKAKKAHGRTGVIWIDAHPDLNTPDTSPSQALHGMPLAALMGMGHPDYVAVAGEKPVLNPKNLVYIGVRDVDPGERNYLDKLGIKAFAMADVKRLGIDEVCAQAKAVIKDLDARVISIDLDGFDPLEAPATGSPVPDGLHAATAFPALKKLAADVEFDLIEIAEYNPMLNGRDQTRAFIEELLKALL